MILTVTVTDAAGTVLKRVTVDLDSAGTNAVQVGLDDIDKALYIAAPEVCPFDCDHCRPDPEEEL